MANDGSQSASRVFLVSDNHPHEHETSKPSPSLSAKDPASNNVKWTLGSSASSASFRRYRSPFRRSAMNTASVNSQCSPSPSFALFRRFYLMSSSLKRRRARDLLEHVGESYSIAAVEKLNASLRIETSHVLSTIAITLVSVCLLILMIVIDFAYLDDAILSALSEPMLTSHPTNQTFLCLRHPKVCVMKGLVILVFISITITLCYSILTLYTRAKLHSLVLERKTEELEKEKCLTEKLLHEILPPCVAKDLINGRKAPAEYYESVTVYFSDIVGFTIIARYAERERERQSRLSRRSPFA